MPSRGRPWRQPWLLHGLATLLILGALAPVVVERQALGSVDTAIKLIQATALSRTSFRSMALPYPAADLDRHEAFLPFVAPFVFLSAGEWQSIFSSFYAVLGALLAPPVLPGLIGLSMLGVAVASAATARLPGAPLAAAPLALLATPLWSYGLAPTETPVALGAGMAALACAVRLPGARGDWLSGVLLGIASLLRDELLLLGPGLLYARHLAGTPARELARTVAGVAVPVVAMAALDQWWFERPMLAHLRHAVPGLDSVLPRSRARLPHLTVMGWRERIATLVEYWLIGSGGLALAALLAAWLAIAHAARRLAPWLVAALVAAAAALHVVDLAALLPAPRIMAGLLRLAPFLLLALLPRAGGGPPPPLVRLAWVASGAYLAAVGLSLNTEGGKPTGPRLIIVLWPLLAAAACETLAGYIAAARRTWPSRVTAAGGLVLVAGSLVMELGVVLPARAARNREDAEAARLVRAVPDEVIVIETEFELQLVGPLYFERRVMMARAPQWRELSRTLAGAGVRSFTYVARPPSFLPAFPEFRQADIWTPGRFLISRWVLEPASSP